MKKRLLLLLMMVLVILNLSGCSMDKDLWTYWNQWISELRFIDNNADNQSSDSSSFNVEDSYEITLDENENGAFG